MNPETDADHLEVVEGLRSKIHDLEDSFSALAKRSERKFKVYLAVGMVLPLALFIGLSVLTNMAFRLDAQALTQIGRMELEKHLPLGRESMQGYLKEKAPAITAHLVSALVGSLPELRPLILRELDEKVRLLTADFEEQLFALMKVSIATAKADLERQFPDTPDSEKIDRLVSAAAERFNQNMEELLLALYPKYAAEMRRVEGYLTHLRDTDESQLKPRERSEKELIETLLRLLAMKAHAGRESPKG